MIVSNQIDGLLDVFVISSSIDCSDIMWKHLIVLIQIKSVDFEYLLTVWKHQLFSCSFIFYKMVKIAL